jgi:hypothetical protein
MEGRGEGEGLGAGVRRRELDEQGARADGHAQAEQEGVRPHGARLGVVGQREHGAHGVARLLRRLLHCPDPRAHEPVERKGTVAAELGPRDRDAAADGLAGLLVG